MSIIYRQNAYWSDRTERKKKQWKHVINICLFYMETRCNKIGKVYFGYCFFFFCDGINYDITNIWGGKYIISITTFHLLPTLPLKNGNRVVRGYIKVENIWKFKTLPNFKAIILTFLLRLLIRKHELSKRKLSPTRNAYQLPARPKTLC